MQTGRSVLINALLNAGGQLEICYWYWSLLSSGSMDFSTLFIVAVLNALMTCWTFGKGELRTGNGSFSIPRFIFHSYNLISHHSFPQFGWFLTVHVLSFESSLCTTCHYDKTIFFFFFFFNCNTKNTTLQNKTNTTYNTTYKTLLILLTI